LVVSPFLSGAFVSELLQRTEVIHVVSTAMAFRKLDQSCFVALAERAVQQSAPTMYMVSDDFGNDEVGRIDGIHAKLLIIAGAEGAVNASLVGSANATRAGWGLGEVSNMESMLELQPGLSMHRFVTDFLLDKRGSPKPWVHEFQPEDRTPISEAEKDAESLRTIARSLASSRLTLRYDLEARRLTVSAAKREEISEETQKAADFRAEFVPLAAYEDGARWAPLGQLADHDVHFENVELSAVSAFVLIRVTAQDNAIVFRTALAELLLPPDLIEARDQEAREHLTANARPEDILAALVLGIAHRAPNRGSTSRPHGGRGANAHTTLLETVTLERLLLAVAANPDLLTEMKLVLGGRAGTALSSLWADVAEVISDKRSGLR
jgi:hypothetical protein